MMVDNLDSYISTHMLKLHHTLRINQNDVLDHCVVTKSDCTHKRKCPAIQPRKRATFWLISRQHQGTDSGYSLEAAKQSPLRRIKDATFSWVRITSTPQPD